MRWSQIEGGTFVKYAWELRVKLSRKVYDTEERQLPARCKMFPTWNEFKKTRRVANNEPADNRYGLVMSLWRDIQITTVIYEL